MNILCAINVLCGVDETFHQIAGDGSRFNYLSIYPHKNVP